jgi:hypothetical protein
MNPGPIPGRVCSARPTPYAVGTVNCLPGVKRQGREADHSPPPSADVTNGGVIPPLLHASLCRSAYLISAINFTFTFLYFLLQQLYYCQGGVHSMKLICALWCSCKKCR